MSILSQKAKAQTEPQKLFLTKNYTAKNSQNVFISIFNYYS